MTGSARRGGAVLGKPIGHSLSPVLHRAAYDALGLDEWTYQAIECDEASLAATLRDLDAQGMAGVSLTMPLKRDVVPLLAEPDDLVTAVGTANTVLFTAAGRWRGANTDVPGMVAALRPVQAQLDDGQLAVVLGSGATAASAVAAIAAIGFAEVEVFARRPEAAIELRGLAAELGLGFSVRPWSEVSAAASARLVISTTPAGSTEALAGALAKGGRPFVPGVLFDVIYAPWPTPLAAAWEGAGGSVVGGIELLIEQAALQVGLMTGVDAPIDAMRAAGRAAVAAK